MVLYGTTHRVGDGVTTAQIIAPDARSDDPAQLAAHCLAAIDLSLAEQVVEGDLLLAGRDFGTGDDPEIAVLALQALGLAAIVCASSASTFVATAESYGLPVIVSAEATATIIPGTVARIDLERGTLTDRTTNAVYPFAPCSPALVVATRRATLLQRMRRVVEDEGFDG